MAEGGYAVSESKSWRLRQNLVAEEAWLPDVFLLLLPFTLYKRTSPVV